MNIFKKKDKWLHENVFDFLDEMDYPEYSNLKECILAANKIRNDYMRFFQEESDFISSIFNFSENELKEFETLKLEINNEDIDNNENKYIDYFEIKYELIKMDNNFYLYLFTIDFNSNEIEENSKKIILVKKRLFTNNGERCLLTEEGRKWLKNYLLK